MSSCSSKGRSPLARLETFYSARFEQHLTEIAEEEPNSPHHAENQENPIGDLEYLSEEYSSVEQENTDFGNTRSKCCEPLYNPYSLIRQLSN